MILNIEITIQESLVAFFLRLCGRCLYFFFSSLFAGRPRRDIAGELMPWALVELDANTGSHQPAVELKFLGRQRFTKSRNPIFKPAGFTPRGGSENKDVERDTPGGTQLPAHVPPREAMRLDGLRGQLQQSEHMQQTPQAPSACRLVPIRANAHWQDGERSEAQSHRGRVLPSKARFFSQQPSPRISVPAGLPAVVPTLGLVSLEDGGVPIWSARRGAAFTPRSQAQEDAKAAHRKSIVNGSMKKLMDKNWVARKTAVEGLVSTESSRVDNPYRLSSTSSGPSKSVRCTPKNNCWIQQEFLLDPS